MQYLDEVRSLRVKLTARYRAGEYAKCVYIGEKLAQLHKRNKNTRSLSFADDLFNLAVVYEEYGNLDKAADSYANSLRVVERLLGEGLEYAERLPNLAAVYAKKGDRSKALGLFLQAEHIIKKRLGSEHPAAVDALYNAANSLRENAMHKKALKAHECVLKLKELHPPDISVADSLNSCGYCCEDLKLPEAAEDYFNRALKLTAEITGEASGEYVSNLLYFAGFLSNNEKLKESIKYFNKASLLIKKLYSERHTYYAGVLNCTAEAYEQTGNMKKALALRMKALNILTRSLGSNHLYFANIMKGIALGYHSIGNSAAAIRMLKRTLKIKESLIGTDNESYARDMLLLVMFYLEGGDYGKMAGTLKNALKRVDFSDPQTPPYYCGLRDLCLLTSEIAKLRRDTDPANGFSTRPFSEDMKKAEALTELVREISDKLIKE